MKKKTALVTGASGFIGQATIESLNSNGWHVIPVSRGVTCEHGIKLDFESPSIFSDLLRIGKVDAMIHLGTKVGFGQEPLRDLFLANVAATSSLVTLARHIGSHFVFASAALVAGTRQSFINDETAENADTAYMQSKLLAEQIIEASGIDAAILRIGGVFGLNGPAHLGLNRAIQSAACGQPPVQVGSGSARRNYAYVKDVAAIIVDVLERKITGRHLVAGTETLTVQEMLQTVCDVFLPGQSPLLKLGDEAGDQVIMPSTSLLPTRSFKSALLDIKADTER